MLGEAFLSRITCVRPCHKADIYACVAAAWQPRAALEAKSEHPRRSRRDGQPQELPAAASIDPTADDCCCATNKLYSELALRCGRIGFRLPVRVPPAAAERAPVGACMTMRSWHGSGGSCAVLAMRDGGRGKNFGCLRPVRGSSAGSRGLSWRFGAGSGGEETHRRGAGVVDGLRVF